MALRSALHRQGIFGAHVDIALVRAYGPGGDDHALDDAVRVALHDAHVHESARVAFVAVADDVFLGVFLVRGPPAISCPSGNPPPPRPLQAGREDGVADVLGGHVDACRGRGRSSRLTRYTPRCFQDRSSRTFPGRTAAACDRTGSPPSSCTAARYRAPCRGVFRRALHPSGSSPRSRPRRRVSPSCRICPPAVWSRGGLSGRSPGSRSSTRKRPASSLFSSTMALSPAALADCTNSS